MLRGVRMTDRHFDKILDIGCGIGFVSQLFPNFDIVGVDISDGMLAQNPHKWIKASAEELPFEDSTFDYIICRSLLHHLDHPNEALDEMYRVLKPGGKWVCWDPNHGVLYELIRSIFQHTDRFSHLHHSFSDSALFEMIEKVGFKITEKRYIGYLAYPLIAFPDIINFHLPIGVGRALMGLDELISKTCFKKLSWSLLVRAIKCGI